MDRLLSKPHLAGKMVKIMNNEIVAKLNLDLSIILSKILPPVKLWITVGQGPTVIVLLFTVSWIVIFYYFTLTLTSLYVF